MENGEWTNEFDILYNNITSNQSPGLDDYEKSVFLTKAYEELVRDYFNPIKNKESLGFDQNEDRQAAFSKLISTKSDFTISDSSVLIPSDLKLFLILNEIATTSAGEKVIIPLHYREYERLLQKPFKYPLRNQAWRIDQGDGNYKIVVGPNETLEGYTMRYIRKPEPIILADFSEDGLSIDGYSAPIDGIVCHADSSVHRIILQRAVELAKASYTGDLSNIVGLGASSQTSLVPPPAANPNYYGR